MNTLKQIRKNTLEKVLIDSGDYTVTFKYDDCMSKAVIDYKPHTIGTYQEVLFDNRFINRILDIELELEASKLTEAEEVLIDELENILNF